MHRKVGLLREEIGLQCQVERAGVSLSDEDGRPMIVDDSTYHALQYNFVCLQNSFWLTLESLMFMWLL